MPLSAINGTTPLAIIGVAANNENPLVAGAAAVPIKADNISALLILANSDSVIGLETCLNVFAKSETVLNDSVTCALSALYLPTTFPNFFKSIIPVGRLDDCSRC